MTDDLFVPLPALYICRVHGALPHGTRECVECGLLSEAYRVAQPGQLTIEDVT